MICAPDLKMAKLTDIVSYLDKYLEIEAFKDDASLNGLQVEGPEEITQLAAAVDSDLRAIEGAARNQAQLLLVHHGLFWARQQRPLTGPEFVRIRELITHNLGVYAAHLPLDAHLEVGNNVMLARLGGLTDVTAWGDYHGKTIGVAGRLKTPIKRENLRSWVDETYIEYVNMVDTGPETIETVGICSGAAADFAEQAHDSGLDLYITGEARHATVHRIREVGQNVVFLGHHHSERGGPQALVAHVAKKFDLPWVFIDSPTGV